MNKREAPPGIRPDIHERFERIRRREEERHRYAVQSTTYTHPRERVEGEWSGSWDNAVTRTES